MVWNPDTTDSYETFSDCCWQYILFWGENCWFKDRVYEELDYIFKHLPKHHMKILLGDFNAKVGRENIFKLATGNESLHQDSNDNGARIINFATSKNLVVDSEMFPHRNIHKYTWTSPDGKTHNHIDHILIDRRWHLSKLHVWSFRWADCDNDHYVVVAKVRERLAVSKQATRKFDVGRFNLWKPSELEVWKQYQINISKRTVALENLSDSEYINRA